MIKPLKISLIALIFFAFIVILSVMQEYSKETISPNGKPSETSGNPSDLGEQPDLINRISGGGGGGDSSGGSGGGSSGSGSSGSGNSITYTTDLSACTNAKNGDLCNGLNLAYGDGYEAACCSERSLCC